MERLWNIGCKTEPLACVLGWIGLQASIMTDESNQSKLEVIRARRREIAEEDKVLAAMEEMALALERQWAAYRSQVTQNVVAPVAAPRALKTIDFRNLMRTPPTRTSLMVQALTHPRPLWQTANDVRGYMVEALGTDVPMSSVSPALTALKNNNTIVRRDMHVALTLRVETEEPGFLNEMGHPQGDGPVTGGDATNLQPAMPDEAQERG
jgi:hypothetical protein